MLLQENLAVRITAELPGPVVHLILTAGRAVSPGQNLYLVGGIVRDLLLWRQSKDIDIMIEGDAVTVANRLSATLESKPTIHKRFGTATFKLADYRIDLSTCRSETYHHPGSLPEVKPGSIIEDLSRRDFTINAMAVSISPTSFGDLIDLCNGRQDLEDRLIRVLHDESFKDDATRIMRAVRYEQRLGFKLEKQTARLLRRDIAMLNTLSGDRLRHELILWLNEQNPELILKRADRLGILSALHHSLSWDPHMTGSFRSAVKLYGKLNIVSLYFALLIYNLNRKRLDVLLSRLNIQGGELLEVSRQTLLLKNRLDELDQIPAKPSEIYSKLNNFHPVAIMANAVCAPSTTARSNLKLYLKKLRFVKTRLTGNDLCSLGVPAGRSTGIILEKLLAARLDGKTRSRTGEEKLALRLLHQL